MADELDSRGCRPMGADFWGERTWQTSLDEHIRDWIGPTNYWNTPDQVAFASQSLRQGEVNAAAARVEQAAATGPAPSQQAFEAWRQEDSTYLQARHGSSTIPEMSAFNQAVINKVKVDNPALVDGMTLAWATQSHGQISSDISQAYCLNDDGKGVNRSLFNRFLAHSAPAGGIDNYMAVKFDSMWQGLNPQGGSIWNHIGLGETPTVPQATLEQKLGEINAKLLRAQL